MSSCHKYSLGENGYEWTEFATLHKSVRYSTSVNLEYPVDPICSLCETVDATWVIGDGDPNSRDTEFVDNKPANRTFKGSLFFKPNTVGQSCMQFCLISKFLKLAFKKIKSS